MGFTLPIEAPVSTHQRPMALNKVLAAYCAFLAWVRGGDFHCPQSPVTEGCFGLEIQHQRLLPALSAADYVPKEGA